MQIPLQITIRDIPPSEALTNHIKEKASKLERFADKIISCHVVVEVPQKHKHNGKIYNTRIDITVPKEEIVINKVQDEDIYVSIRDAFNAAKRKLKTNGHIKRGEVKNHIPMTHGHVARIFEDEGYGFLESLDGREFYFNSTNIAYPDFSQLEVGMAVQFLEAIADEGLQANRVTAGKHTPLDSDSI